MNNIAHRLEFLNEISQRESWQIKIKHRNWVFNTHFTLLTLHYYFINIKIIINHNVERLILNKAKFAQKWLNFKNIWNKIRIPVLQYTILLYFTIFSKTTAGNVSKVSKVQFLFTIQLIKVQYEMFRTYYQKSKNLLHIYINIITSILKPIYIHLLLNLNFINKFIIFMIDSNI